MPELKKGQAVSHKNDDRIGIILDVQMQPDKFDYMKLHAYVDWGKSSNSKTAEWVDEDDLEVF